MWRIKGLLMLIRRVKFWILVRPYSLSQLILYLVGVAIVRSMKRLTLVVGLVLRAVRSINLKIWITCGGKVRLWLLVDHRLLRVRNRPWITNILALVINRRSNLRVHPGTTLAFQLLVLQLEHLNLSLLLLA